MSYFGDVHGEPVTILGCVRCIAMVVHVWASCLQSQLDTPKFNESTFV